MTNPTWNDRAERAIFRGIGLISLASLLFELTLTRIFSVVMYYHFAFMVISLAMFGFGVSGLVAYFRPHRFPAHRLGRILWRYGLYFSVSVIFSLLVVLQAQIDLSFKRENILKLVLIYLVASLPFYFVGICVSVGMTHLNRRIGKLYFYDLLGAGIGCMAAIPVMNMLGGPGAVLVCAAVGAVGSLAFSPQAGDEFSQTKAAQIPLRRPFLMLGGLVLFLVGAAFLGRGLLSVGSGYFEVARFGGAAVVAAGVGAVLLFIGRLPRTKTHFNLPLALAGMFVILALVNVKVEFLRVVFTKGAREENIVFSKWNSFSRISVERHPASGAHTMRIDADAATHVVKTDGAGRILDPTPFREGVSGMAYHIRPNVDEVLIIGPGGGWDIATASAFGAKHVTGCEINPIIVNDVMKGQFREYTGRLYEFPNVEVKVGEGRSFIRNSGKKFNVIQATLVDTWAATAGGALSLTENNLYTVEAFEDYLDHLTDDGIITMSRWLMNPDQQNLRLMSLGLEALARGNVPNPEKHFMMVSSGKGLEATQQRICSVLLKKTPFTDEEIRAFEAETEKYGFEVVYTPLTRPDNAFTRLLTTKDREAYYREYQFDITPTFDNKPFFFFTLKSDGFLDAFSGDYEMVKNNAGLLALLSLLVIVFVLACGCIIVPLFVFKRDALRNDTANRVRCILYFAGLGLAFMAVEMALLQKFVFFLGHPVYALAVVLFSILIFSGIGSFLTERISPTQAPGTMRLISVGMCVLVGIYLAVLPTLLYRFLGLSVPVKIAVSVLMLAPLSILMGMPLPLGIKTIRSKAADMIPWAWGVNGALSVLGSVSAVTAAIYFGYNALLVIGAIVYVLAGLILPGKLAEEAPASETDAVAVEAGAPV